MFMSVVSLLYMPAKKVLIGFLMASFSACAIAVLQRIDRRISAAIFIDLFFVDKDCLFFEMKLNNLSTAAV